jgi:hypothetical protein
MGSAAAFQAAAGSPASSPMMANRLFRPPIMTGKTRNEEEDKRNSTASSEGREKRR